MKTPGSIRSLAAILAGLSVATTSVASAAAVAPQGANPLVTLSVFGSAQSRAALCAAGSAAVTAAATTAAAQSRPGCVLPIADAPPPPVVSDVPPPMMPAAPYATAAAGANLWPLLVGLGLFSAIFFLLDDEILGDGGDFRFDRSPG